MFGQQVFKLLIVAVLMGNTLTRTVLAASPCDLATHKTQCGWFDANTIPPYVRDAILSKGGTFGAGEVLVLTSGLPADGDTEISNAMMQAGCGTNPDGWQTYDCVLLDAFVPPQDSVVLALSSEWFEWYQTIFTDWMTISGVGVSTVDVSINSWVNNKVDIIPYGPMETGVVVLTSLAASKMVNFRVADSGDSIYDTALVVVPATWLGALANSNQDQTLLCGDGFLDPGEECDDGNTITDDGCSSICLGTQIPSAGNQPSQTCGNLNYTWSNGQTAPYTCGNDLCMGYRCVSGTAISPACYAADQCAATCSGGCVDVQVAQLDCSTMCDVQPPATEPPPPPPVTCASLSYSWPDGSTMPYTCDENCLGQRCVWGTTISPTCYDPGECDMFSCPDGVCVDIATTTCEALCAMAEQSATCTAAEQGKTRPAPNQKGMCVGNVEICKNLIWKIADGSWEPDDEKCNGVDDDCNGVADDMFETCGDPGLCQNTVNTCDPENPTVPVACVTLPPPSPVEICNDGLDNDCDGSEDDGCKCGDDECMPGESYLTCANDCPPPPDGTPCEDNNLCTIGDVFQNGVCKPGVAVVCNADNACVVAPVCNPSSGCSAIKLDCDDNDPCTLDQCDPAAGCYYELDPSCQQGTDEDEDGYTSLATGGTDCDDQNPDIHPGATEVCNTEDDNCNGLINDGDTLNCECTVDGDLTGDGTLSVVDVQCHILVVLWALMDPGQALPGCLSGGSATAANMNCDASTDVSDVILVIGKVLGAPMNPDVDNNGNGCVDVCEVPALTL